MGKERLVRKKQKVKEGDEVILHANKKEGWKQEQATVVSVNYRRNYAVVFVEPHQPGDDGYREIDLGQIKKVFPRKSMKKRSITITFESTAQMDAIEEVAEHMRWQLDSLCDGTISMDDDKTFVHESYGKVLVKVK